MPISGKDMRKLFLRAGYEIVPGGRQGESLEAKEKGPGNHNHSKSQGAQARNRTLTKKTA